MMRSRARAVSAEREEDGNVTNADGMKRVKEKPEDRTGIDSLRGRNWVG